MTLFQIYCVIQLLLAFNVPAPTVANVQLILERSIASTSPALPTDLPGLSYGAAHYAPAVELAPIVQTKPHGEIKIATTRHTADFNGPLSGIVNLWERNRITEDSDEISDPSWVTFSINGQQIGKLNGTRGNYFLTFDTTLYENNYYTVNVTVDDGQGFVKTGNFTIEIKN